MRPQQLSRHITFRKRRARRRIADRVHRLETVGELALQFPKLGLKKHVRVAVDAEDEGDLRLVLGVLEDGARELIHGGDARTAGDESDLGVLVGRPFVSEQRAGFERERLAWKQGVEMVAHFTVWVALYEKVDVAGRIWVTDGGVWPQDG